MAKRSRATRTSSPRPRIPKVVVIAGPNGAGKSTSAKDLLRGNLRVREFINADDIAREISAEDTASAAIAAGRRMVRRIHELADKRASFAFETTLASRSFAPWIKGLLQSGFEFGLVFLWLPAPEVAIRRVQDRVRRGGHSVPEATVRRRYRAGIRNFFSLYQPLASTWQMIDNSIEEPRLVAAGIGRRASIVRDQSLWRKIRKSIPHEKR
jgi:predicted ABC-type ATPase